MEEAPAKHHPNGVNLRRSARTTETLGCAYWRGDGCEWTMLSCREPDRTATPPARRRLVELGRVRHAELVGADIRGRDGRRSRARRPRDGRLRRTDDARPTPRLARIDRVRGTR